MITKTESGNCAVDRINSYIGGNSNGRQVRYIKGKRLPHNQMDCANLLMRIRSKEKAHETSGFIRQQAGPEIEFSTMCINSEFSQKIRKLKRERRLNICVFDDYMTYGNSFNAVRNMLNYLGANKIVFVSLGTFGKPFEKWDYEISGNIFDMTFLDVLKMYCEHEGIPLESGQYKDTAAKGQLGNFLEKHYFGYDPNGNQEADFKESGVELKQTCIDVKKG